MAQPLIIMNFKTYAESSGDRAVELAKTCEKAATAFDADIRLAVQAADISRVAAAVSLPVYAQHVDPCGQGANTGWMSLETLRAAGASGVFINHSEHPLDDEIIKKTMDCITGMDTIVFAADVPKLQALAAEIQPTWFCIEPPELISSKDASISSSQPELIDKAVAAVTAPVLVGAGVKTYEDIHVQERLGAYGVVLASGVILAEDQYAALEKLLTRS